MKVESLTNVSFSRFAFVFLIFSVITSGYINEILSCQMRHFLLTSIYFRHLLGILMVFVFIMLEGGWSFDTENDSIDSNNWASGHVLHTLVYAILIYSIFVISSKSRLVPNLIFYVLVFVLYCMNTQRTYWYRRDQIDDKRNKEILQVQYVLMGVALVVLVAGFIDYILYQKKEYGKDFEWEKFLVGTSVCKNIEKNVL